MSAVSLDPQMPSGDPKKSTAPWYRRRWVLWSAGISVFAGAAVLSDLPQHTTRAAQISDATSIVSQINADVRPCVYAAKEAFLIKSGLADGSLSPADRARVPGLLRDDQNACAFTNSAINDLANLSVPGSSAGKDLNNLVNSVTLWASSDALGAVEAIQTLASRPGDSPALAHLREYEAMLAADRSTAQSQLNSAQAILRVQLPALTLPELPAPAQP